MNIKEIMTESPACCTADATLQETAKMMVDNDCGCIPVIENETNRKPVGTITDRDIVTRALAEGKNPLDLTVGDIMTKNVVTVSADDSVADCCAKMEENQIRRIVVVDEKGGCCGMVAQADIAVKADSSKTAQVVEQISK